MARPRRNRPVDRYLHRLKVGGGLDLEVGIRQREGSVQYPGEDVTLATVGAFHEVGLGVPQRSFLRSTLLQNLTEYQRGFVKALRHREPRTKLQLLGFKIVADIQSRIRSNIPPELSRLTVSKKGSSTALIDTGRLIQSITSAVVGRGY